MKDSRRKSILKALSWRAIATTTTMILTYIATGRLEAALGVGAMDLIIKLFLYYLHERAWLRVKV